LPDDDVSASSFRVIFKMNFDEPDVWRVRKLKSFRASVVRVAPPPPHIEGDRVPHLGLEPLVRPLPKVNPFDKVTQHDCRHLRCALNLLSFPWHRHGRRPGTGRNAWMFGFDGSDFCDSIDGGGGVSASEAAEAAAM
jgi:hypothetical protein